MTDTGNTPEVRPTGGLFNDRVYDKLKFLAVVVLPAVGALYFALATVWGLPHAEEVVGTVVAIDAFLGVLLQISNAKYNNSDGRFDGAIDVSPSSNGTSTYMNVSLDPNAVARKKEITIKVNQGEMVYEDDTLG